MPCVHGGPNNIMKKFKNNTLTSLLVIAAVLFLPVVFAHAFTVKNSDGSQSKVAQNTRVGIMTPITTARNQVQAKQQTQGQQRPQEPRKLMDQQNAGGQTGNMKQKRNQKQERTEEQEGQEDSEHGKRKVNQINGAKHRSAVANAVLNLLQAASKQAGPVGEQIKTIAQEQNSIKDSMSSVIDKIRNRGGFKTFLLGVSYKNLGQLRSDVAKTTNQLTQLKDLLSKTTNDTAKAIIRTQVADLQQEQQKVTNLIQENKSKFSLFGWLGKLFTRQSS